MRIIGQHTRFRRFINDITTYTPFIVHVEDLKKKNQENDSIRTSR